jgi:hypothetical protein
MGFDYNTVMQLKELMIEIVKTHVDDIRPRYQYGIVQSIDRVKQKCTVLFTGDDIPIPVNMGSIQPMAVGQRVRIDGVRGDRYISDVIGQAFLTGPEIFTPALSSGVISHDDQFGHKPYGVKNNFGEAQLWGTIRRSSGSFASGNFVLTVPAKYRPAKTTFFLLTSQWTGAGQYITRGEINSAGQLMIVIDAAAPGWISLDQARWPLANP